MLCMAFGVKGVVLLRPRGREAASAVAVVVCSPGDWQLDEDTVCCPNELSRVLLHRVHTANSMISGLAFICASLSRSMAPHGEAHREGEVQRE